MVISKPRKRNRLPNYDYSSPGWYYVTICTHKLKYWLGKIKNGKIQLNNCGYIVKKKWLWLEKHFEYIELDEYVIMPNHLHGILIINSYCRDNPRIVPTINATNTIKTKIYQRRFNTLSKTINAFKTTASKHIHLSGLKEFKWQRSFYDHIIRNETSLYKIRQYIEDNPSKWEVDKLYSK